MYGAPALLWIGVIMSFIGGLFSNFYSKYFPEAAPILLAVTLAYVFKKRLKLLVRTAQLLYLDKKELLMSAKSRMPLFALVALVLVVLLIPWSRRRVSAEARLRPETVVRIEAPEDGVVEEVLLRESDPVKAGQPILRLSSPDRVANEVRLSQERQRYERATGAARQEASASGVLEASAREASAAAGLTSERVRRGRLAVSSPISGCLLTPRLQDLQGLSVTAGALLAEVGDVRHLAADLPITERLVGDFAVGSPVYAFLPERPLSGVPGRVVRISTATMEQSRTTTSADPSVPPERPDRFVAVASFDNADGVLKPGGLVRAKIYGRRASYASRVWRVLQHWIQRIAW
jgi:multidrug efflux pump subunit AcrA (membrane-fusion protein)